jgi:hypothetical protein
MKSGDTVRLIGIPSDLHEDAVTVFEKCLGRTFVIDHFNDAGWAGLVFDSVTGSRYETIWVAPAYLEPVSWN